MSWIRTIYKHICLLRSLFICLFFCLLVCFPVFVFVCLFFLFVYLFVCLFVSVISFLLLLLRYLSLFLCICIYVCFNRLAISTIILLQSNILFRNWYLCIQFSTTYLFYVAIYSLTCPYMFSYVCISTLFCPNNL